MSPILQGLANGSVRGYGGYLPLGPDPAFISIATVASSGSSGTLTFSSIPSTYKHLQIRGIANDINANTLRLRFNSDSGTNYTNHTLEGNGSVVQAAGNASGVITGIFVASLIDTANMFNAMIIDIHDYASTTKNKTVRIFSGKEKNASGGSSGVHSGLWLNTSAVTSISLYIPTNTLTNGTSFALYGIKET